MTEQHHDHTEPVIGCRCAERYPVKPEPPKRSCYLGPQAMFRLDLACKPLAEAFGPPYLVGSVNERPDFRDVDVRLILADEEYDRLGRVEWTVLGLAISGHLRASTDLPIDFQFQRMSEATLRYRGEVRNPLGGRKLAEFSGDWGGA